MIYIIGKILAILAVIAGFIFSYKHWDGRQLITLIANGVIMSFIFMIPVGIILIIIQGIFDILGYVVIACGIGALAYFIYAKVKR